MCGLVLSMGDAQENLAWRRGPHTEAETVAQLREGNPLTVSYNLLCYLFLTSLKVITTGKREPIESRVLATILTNQQLYQ